MNDVTHYQQNLVHHRHCNLISIFFWQEQLSTASLAVSLALEASHQGQYEQAPNG